MAFVNIIEIGVGFSNLTETTTSDFVNIGDEGTIIITETTGYGEGPYGEGPYGGGTTTTIISPSPTVWTEVTDR